MTWSAAFPGVAARVLRGVSGRRALHVGLLLGGLFVLAFLCGEQAYAADGVGAVPVKAPVRSLTSPTAPGVTDSGVDKGTDTGEGAEAGSRTDAAPGQGASNSGSPKPPAAPVGGGKVLRPVTEAIVTVVSDGVVRPVGDLVEKVASGLTETVGLPPVQSLPELPPLPSLPSSPELPQPPSWPTVPTAPEPPSAPSLPAPAPVPAPVPAPPVVSAPQPGAGDHSKAEPAEGEPSTSDGAAYGPWFTGRDSLTGLAVLGSTRHVSTQRIAVHRPDSTAPAHQMPSDGQGGALSGKSAVDNGSSRHGDAHAVTLDHRAPLRLVPGAAADVDAAGTRDSHRDIPVFPG
ncbi:hypothetical protein [Streptomyces sp. 351MFTsu5.1]|uniref:hypothetical protein n=1 Tax=Streptomyces sp. 351MFTsu5.1 TaxID=1172180 RepID=UPI0003AA3708|nr:hypothetical protein [Streptomyces sp. 351MFTsu5.1]